jgi:ferredoxin-type protein NapG
MSDRGGVSRRELLTGAFRPREAALATTAGLVWTHAVSSPGTELTVRPPGAKQEKDFVATCIKCGQCVEACPFDTLALARASDDELIGTPYFEPRKVPCYMCEEPEKGVAIEDARMGLAVLADQESCLAFQGLRCEVCYRACPLMGRAIALEFRPQERTGKHAFFIPVVNSDYCTGCGMCEHACVLEETAIRVLPPSLAQGRMGENYRLGWLEEAEISRDFEAPESAPDLPQWRGSLDRVLEQMDDLTGIEEP